MGERFGQVPERVMRDGRLSAWDWRLLLALLVLSRKDRERLFLVPARVRVSTLARMLGEEGELGEAASRKRQVLRALARNSLSRSFLLSTSSASSSRQSHADSLPSRITRSGTCPNRSPTVHRSCGGTCHTVACCGSCCYEGRPGPGAIRSLPMSCQPCHSSGSMHCGPDTLGWRFSPAYCQLGSRSPAPSRPLSMPWQYTQGTRHQGTASPCPEGLCGFLEQVSPLTLEPRL